MEKNSGRKILNDDLIFGKLRLIWVIIIVSFYFTVIIFGFGLSIFAVFEQLEDSLRKNIRKFISLLYLTTLFIITSRFVSIVISLPTSTKIAIDYLKIYGYYYLPLLFFLPFQGEFIDYFILIPRIEVSGMRLIGLFSYLNAKLIGLIFFLSLIILMIPVVRFLFEQGVLGGEEPKMSIEESAAMMRGMLKSTNQLNISELASQTGETKQFWRGRLYTLIGNQAIEGEFDGSIFTMTEDSNIEHVIDSLLGKFEEMEETRVGKLE